MTNQNQPIRWARKCDVLGHGMNDGWCFGDGEQYASTIEAAEKIALDRGHDSLDEAYKSDDCYWTEWEDETDYQYEERDGELIEIQ